MKWPVNTKPFTWADKLEHVAIALGIQGVVWLVTGSPWIGGAFAAGLFYGREERDDENRHLREPGYPNWRNALPWLWSVDGIVDFVAPLAMVLAVALIFG